MANRKLAISKIQDKAAELQYELQDLIDDCQEALDNIPENLQSGDNYQRASDRIDLLTAWCDELENIATEEVE